MLTISRLHKESLDKVSAENLYLTAFPEIERHPIEELYNACDTGKCEWLTFKDGESFIGLENVIDYRQKWNGNMLAKVVNIWIKRNLKTGAEQKVKALAAKYAK